MGKTSFIQYVSRMAEGNFQMIPIHFNNRDGVSIDELILKLIEKLSEEFDKGYWGKNFVDGYLKRILEVKLAGFGFSLEKQNELIHDIKSNFSKLLIEICEDFEDKGIFSSLMILMVCQIIWSLPIDIKAFLNQFNLMNIMFQ